MTTKRDFYEILGVDKSASDDEIKRSYRKMAMKYHPDVNKEKEAEVKFKEISEAYQVLSDPNKRKQYDQFGHAAFDAASGFGGFHSGQSYQSGPFQYSYSSSSGANFGDFGDPFDIFEQFFGGGFRRAQVKPRYSVRIEFMEAVNGTERKIVHQGKEHIVKIPAGVDDGTRIRFNDFDVTIDVKPHEYFKREGLDVFVDHFVSFTTAALGGKETIKTIDGDLNIKIRPGTQPGTMIRLRGKGIKHVRGRGRGDQYIRIMIKVPTKINRQQKRKLQELEEAFS